MYSTVALLASLLGLVAFILWVGFKAGRGDAATKQAKDNADAAEKYRKEAEIRARNHPDAWDDIVDRLR